MVPAALVLSLVALGVDAGVPAWLPQAQPVAVVDRGAYQLRPDGDGYLYDTPRFRARVARDGTVAFHDKRSSAGLSLPKPLKDLPRPAGPTLEGTLRDLVGKRRRKRPAPPPPTASPPAHDYPIDPSERCSPTAPCPVSPMTNAIEVTGSFDLTDEIMRALGQDPYRYEKARFLSATFELRIAMAIEARKTDLKTSLADLPRRLEALWADERYTARERRRILYELWYETDQTTEGKKAAASIVDFIRRRLPCGAANGYSPGEIGALDRSHADRRFPPARDCDRMRGE